MQKKDLRLNINPNAILINKLASHNAGHKNQNASQHRNVNPPGYYVCRWVLDTQQPVQRGERKHHNRKNSVAPGTNQTTNFVYCNQVNQAKQAGDGAHNRSGTSKPKPCTSPEWIVGIQVGKISRYQSDQGRDREVNQHWVKRVPRNRHPTDYFLLSHSIFLSVFSKAQWYSKSISTLLTIFTFFLIAGCKGPQSTLDPAGIGAGAASFLWWFMCIFFSIVFIGVVALWFYAMRPKDKALKGDALVKVRRRMIIGGGLLLPAISIFILIILGIPLGNRMMPFAPSNNNVMVINVVGHQWWWEVQYPKEGIRLINEVHIPVNHPVDIHATSADVIHSFWVPRLNGKIDMIPGHTNILRLQAQKPGQYRGQCAEFCGLWHANMVINVFAHTPETFQSWLEENKARSSNESL